jgi:3-oxoadipate enol-lactonase
VLLAIAAPMPVLARHVAHELFPRVDQASLRQVAVARLASNSRRHYLACLGAIASFDVRERLGQIGCPTLVLAGSRDTTVPHAAKELLASAIPGARLCVVDGSAHVIPYDRPERFNELLLQHLGTVEPSRSWSVDKPKPLTQYR